MQNKYLNLWIHWSLVCLLFIYGHLSSDLAIMVYILVSNLEEMPEMGGKLISISDRNTLGFYFQIQ